MKSKIIEDKTVAVLESPTLHKVKGAKDVIVILNNDEELGVIVASLDEGFLVGDFLNVCDWDFFPFIGKVQLEEG